MTIRWNWGIAMALVYALFAAGTLSVVMLASATGADLVSDDYYQRALTFDRQIEAAARGQVAGVSLVMDTTIASPRLTVAFPSNGPVPTSGAVTLYRAADGRNDRSFPLSVDTARRQVIELRGVPTGHWTVQLSWQAAGVDYYMEQEIVTP